MLECSNAEKKKSYIYMYIIQKDAFSSFLNKNVMEKII